MGTRGARILSRIFEEDSGGRMLASGQITLEKAQKNWGVSSVYRVTDFDSWVYHQGSTLTTCPFIPYQLLTRLSGKGPHQDGNIGITFLTIIKAVRLKVIEITSHGTLVTPSMHFNGFETLFLKQISIAEGVNPQ